MLIRIPPAHHIPEREVTPEALYERRGLFLNRRSFMAAGAAAALAALLPGSRSHAATNPLESAAKSPWSTDEKLTDMDAVTGYNNFYEFGLDKDDPAKNAQNFRARPWTVEVTGLAARPQVFDVDDLIRRFPLEERIYRLRCVEGWSMVIPWIGFPLAALLREVEPLGAARYVAFETLHDPRQMPGQRRAVLKWPYREGLRLDEAMHDLTLLSVGLYGKLLPNQNGAPIRLVVPWKYGFKSIKSVVRITLTDKEPATSWNLAAPHEYGFYANVNPEVDHPRWSQARERRIGEFFRRPTLMFNGYGDAVAQLYAGMDLGKHF